MISPTASQPSAAALPPLEELEMLLFIRHFELALLRLFQEGRLSGTTHTCLGQEAIPVALMPLLRDDDFVFSNHRGHGHYLARFGRNDRRNCAAGLLAEIMGREGAVCHGVGGSQHIRRGRYFSTGVQGESLPVAVGAALQLKREGQGGVAVPFIGDGTWGQGAVYEALNMAALWQVPLVVMVENNGISQTTSSQTNLAGTIEARARAFGVDYLRCTEDDVVALRSAFGSVIENARQQHRPAVIECLTRRLAAHSKGDDTRPAEEIARHHEESWVERLRLADPDLFTETAQRIHAEIEEIVAEISPQPASTWSAKAPKPKTGAAFSIPARQSERVVENLNRALHASMAGDDQVWLIGEDLLDPYGGAFKAARGLSTAYPERLVSTPISELAIAGVANGLALAGQRPIAEFMFGDFIFLAADQIINFAAKSVTMYGEAFAHPVLFRCPVGGHRGYGATHSQSVQKHFIGVPNLDLYEISPLHDLSAYLPRIFATGNPAILFESKTLYAQAQLGAGELDELFTCDFVDAEGFTARATIEDIAHAVIIAPGGQFPAAFAAAKRLFFEHEIEVQIFVPFRLYPFDAAPFRAITAPIYVVEESSAGGTWGAEVAAALGRPVQVLHSADAIIPSARHLENEVLLQPETIVQRIAADFHAAHRRSHHQ